MTEAEIWFRVGCTKLTLAEALHAMDDHYYKLCHCSSTGGRRMNGMFMSAYLDFYPELKVYWKYDKDNIFWEHRFRKVAEGIFSSIRPFEDGINYDAPDHAGLYFIGETHFNPKTREEYYLVKIGKATNLQNRMIQYNTHCPMLWRIDYCAEYDKEEEYQRKLKKVCTAVCKHNKEWFYVDRETYLEMCEKGFNYFN